MFTPHCHVDAWGQACGCCRRLRLSPVKSNNEGVRLFCAAGSSCCRTGPDPCWQYWPSLVMEVS